MMQFICSQQDLSRGLSIVSHAISNKSALPILSNVLVATDGGRLKLCAMNQEFSITYWIDAQIQAEGMITVPAKLMTEYVGTLSPDPVKIMVPEATSLLGLTSPSTVAHIKGKAPDEFPNISEVKEYHEPPVLLDAKLLKNMITYVSLAASTDDSRPVLTGVLVRVGNETLTLAAADGFRFAVRSAPLSGATALQQDIILPARALEELARILSPEGPVAMIVAPSRNQILFHTEQIDFTSRLVEGIFPDYSRLLPTAFTTRAVVGTKDLASALRGAALFAQDSSHRVQLKLSPKMGTLTLEASALNLGENWSIVPAHIEGPEQEIAFNVKYLSEVVAVIESSQVAIELMAPTKPGIIQPVSLQDYMYAVMPLQVQS